MSDVILRVENVSKQYRLGTFGTNTIGGDFHRWWTTKIRGKEDPFLKVGDVNDRTSKVKSDFVWALKDINFEVKRGEVLGIIGKNGAGKSTLLKLLSRITTPTTGSIESWGRMASLLEVGTGFHPELTGRENIFLNGAILGMTKSEIKRKLDEIIDFSGCALYIDTPVKRYSSGMTVRLGFAVAAFLDPEILIVDEVLAVGDAEFQKKAIGKMQDISRGEGRTVLFVSHNMAAVTNLCKKGVVLENGNVIFEGSIENAVNKYLQKDLIKSDVFKNIKRIGNGILKVVSIKVYGENQNSIPQTGKPFHIEIDIEKSTSSITNVRLDLKIDDIMGARHLWFSSEFAKNKMNANTTKLFFYISKLNLNYGGYLISTDLYMDTVRTDWIQQAIGFDVEEGLFYNKILNIPAEETKVLLDYQAEWR